MLDAALVGTVLASVAILAFVRDGQSDADEPGDQSHDIGRLPGPCASLHRCLFLCGRIVGAAQVSRCRVKAARAYQGRQRRSGLHRRAAATLHWGSVAVAFKIAAVWLFALWPPGATAQLMARRADCGRAGHGPMTLAFDLILCLMIVGTAAAALLTHNALAAIVFIVFGNLLGLAWLAMNLVNVAMAEIAIGAGITGVLLILTRQRLMALGDDLVSAETPGWLRAGAVLACTGLTALVGSAVLVSRPQTTWAGQSPRCCPELGIENPVTGVLLAFRAYDTLLETFVLLGALVAVWSLAPGNAWPRPPRH